MNCLLVFLCWAGCLASRKVPCRYYGLHKSSENSIKPDQIFESPMASCVESQTASSKTVSFMMSTLIQLI
ncbi:hypothetical protein DC094_04145 [Pelagibaculum spongiae]|uniref:Uncharacterized protein n=1 Tax=Pelagibaculum spongiae TaxID=2080658 RepID=A0A2V1GYT4_9GAMM|nr:hypothetical protein DC094_04145 [Pelagibaculum spongiae]